MRLIKYEHQLDFDYDLEGDPYRRNAMLREAIPKNIKFFGNVETWLNKLREQKAMIELQINGPLIKWFTLDQQIKFIEKCQAGEMPEFNQVDSGPETPEIDVA